MKNKANDGMTIEATDESVTPSIHQGTAYLRNS